MRIRQSSIDQAVLLQFRDLRRLYPFARIPLSHVEGHWKGTGFRREDLQVALDRLDARQCLRIEEGEVVLLEDGYRRLVSHRWSPWAAWRELRSAFGVLIASLRLRAPPRPLGQRRDSDPKRESL